jgi:hypothetical protein
MTEPYQIIVDLLKMLSATDAKKTLSRYKKLTTKAAEQVTKKDILLLQKIAENWNDYNVITAVQNLEYLVPLLEEFRRILMREYVIKRKPSQDN